MHEAKFLLELYHLLSTHSLGIFLIRESCPVFNRYRQTFWQFIILAIFYCQLLDVYYFFHYPWNKKLKWNEISYILWQVNKPKYCNVLYFVGKMRLPHFAFQTEILWFMNFSCVQEHYYSNSYGFSCKYCCYSKSLF